MRQEVVWDIFEQNASNHFSVHVGSVKCEERRVKRKALWNFSLILHVLAEEPLHHQNYEKVSTYEISKFMRVQRLLIL